VRSVSGGPGAFTWTSPRANDEEVRYAISIRLAHILGGGYAKDQRRLSPEVRAVVIDRDGGRCRLSGAEGTEITTSRVVRQTSQIFNCSAVRAIGVRPNKCSNQPHQKHDWRELDCGPELRPASLCGCATTRKLGPKCGTD
jgi:hypothetical protein